MFIPLEPKVHSQRENSVKPCLEEKAMKAALRGSHFLSERKYKAGQRDVGTTLPPNGQDLYGRPCGTVGNRIE